METFIPLFPLNTVYFPGNIIEIQIFEERYKKLFSSVIQNNFQIGIFCIKEGVEAYGPLPIPYPIGTLAKIFDYQIMPLPIYKKEDNYIIKAKLIGIRKIKLLYEYESQDHYWIGNIIPCEENYNTSEINKEKVDLFYEEFLKFLKYHHFQDFEENYKDNVIFLCHQALQYLSIPIEEKQKLLEISNFLQRWEKTYQYLKEKNQIIEKLNDKNINWESSQSN